MTQDWRHERLSWDECLMHIAYLMSQRSPDPNTQAGSCIVNESNIIVGLGYNGWPRGIKNDDLPWEREGDFLDRKYAYVVHAEENAVYNANNHTEGCRLYSTLFPCNECAKTIIQSGLKEVIYLSDKYHDHEAWIAARKLFDLAGVRYRQYKPKFTIKLEENHEK